MLPPASIAMPRAYWLGFDKHVLSSQIFVAQPSKYEYNRIQKAIASAKSNDYDMEIVNTLYKDNALIIPHRQYDMLSGELCAEKHAAYLGNEEEKWNPDAAMKEAKLIHFSDWPMPKV